MKLLMCLALFSFLVGFHDASKVTNVTEGYSVNGTWSSMNTENCTTSEGISSEVTVPKLSTVSCFFEPEHPKNSHPSCVFDRRLGFFVECTHTCHPGFHYDEFVITKTQKCIEGKWLPEQIGHCSDQKENFTIPETRCSSIPYLPQNSVYLCTHKNESPQRRSCRYVCKEGYLFKDKKSLKTQLCVNGSWTPENLGDCIKATNESDTTSSSCSPADLKPLNNALTSIHFNETIGRYTYTKNICFEGYYFHSTVNEISQLCVNGTWMPNLRGCKIYNFTSTSAPANPCTTRPKQVPNNSAPMCRYNESERLFDECTYTCHPGFHYDDFLIAKTQKCIEGKWLPEQIGHCSDRIANFFMIPESRCSLIPYLPQNSIYLCTYNNESEQRSCRYVCKEEYLFKDKKNAKRQLCVNGSWSPDNIGDCIKATNKTDSTSSSCSPADVKPLNNALSSIYFNETIGRYTYVKNICFEGYYFHTTVNEISQLCVNGTWMPELKGCKK